MAKIPSAQFSQRIRTDVAAQPTRSISSAGIAASGQAALGRGLMSAGLTGVNLINQREKAKDETFFLTEKTRFRAERTKRNNRLEKELKGQDPGDFAKNNQTWYDEQRDSAMERATSQGQKELLQNFYEGEKISGGSDDEVFEHNS